MFCCGVTAQLWFGPLLFLRFLHHTGLDTQPVGFLWASDQPVTYATTYTTHSKYMENNTHALGGIRTSRSQQSKGRPPSISYFSNTRARSSSYKGPGKRLKVSYPFHKFLFSSVNKNSRLQTLPQRSHAITYTDVQRNASVTLDTISNLNCRTVFAIDRVWVVTEKLRKESAPDVGSDTTN